MSGEFYCFNFSLRGPDSLASKWISEKRKTKGTLKENGANIYAISDYIHEVFCFEKLYGTEHTSNILFNQMIKLNNFDKDHIVLFEDIILIPFTFSMRSYESGSFKEFTNDFEQEPIYEDKPASKSKLGDLLSATEIKEMLINIYHINYDLRSDVNIKDKKYDEIIKGEYLNFKDKAKLDLFAPYIFEIPTQKVVNSSEEAPVEVLMEETTVQPEIVNTAVEGYFYLRTGKPDREYNKKYKGTSKNVYCIDEIKKSYTQSDCVKLPYTYNDFRTICNIVKHECTSSDEDEFKAVAYASYNRAKTKYANEKSWLKLLKSSYSSVNEIYKTPLDDEEKGANDNLARRAVIYVLEAKEDITDGAEYWDGGDFLAVGMETDPGGNKGQGKFREYKFIEISNTLYNSYKAKWPNSTYKYKESKKHTKDLTHTPSETHTHDGDRIVYNCPAEVFTDKNNRNKNDDFYYLTDAKNKDGTKATKGITATLCAGDSIFWKVVTTRTTSED